MRLREPLGSSATSPRCDRVLDRRDHELEPEHLDPAIAVGEDRFGKLSPVSTCMIGNGIRAGAKALRAMWSITIESLPPENSRHGRCISAATSRKMWMLSASRVRSWLIEWGVTRDPPPGRRRR